MVPTGQIPKQPKIYRCELDEEGRIRLPIQVQQVLRLKPFHRVDLKVEDGRVTLEHAWPCCYLCGGSRELRRFHGAFLCETCLNQIRSEDYNPDPLPDDVGLFEG